LEDNNLGIDCKNYFMNLDILSIVIAIITALTVHEFAHAWTANYLGDPTAKYAGRITLNPIRHLDPIGTLVMIVLIIGTGIGFGWGKPVPVNPYNLKHRYGELLVSIVGPLSNFILAFLIALLLVLLPPVVTSSWSVNFHSLIWTIIQINIILGLFNMLPIPPLDGSKVLFNLISNTQSNVRSFLERYGIFLLIGFIFFFSGIFFAATLGIVNLFQIFEVWGSNLIYS